VGVSLLDLQLSQIVKCTQQYFKFEDVFESLTCDPQEDEEEESQQSLDTEVSATTSRDTMMGLMSCW
jgi:hypothetical protein